MRSHWFTAIACLLLDRAGYAAPPAGYYDAAAGRTGQQLRQTLHTIIRGHTVIPYSSSSFDTSDALKVLDEDPANTNNVILLYARRSEPKTNFPAVWNREHCWPNSYGLDDKHPAFSDLHNLRAEDMNVNSARGNKYYDVSDTNDANYMFPAHAEASECSEDFDSWSPPASVRGDIARAMLYMDVRYEGMTGSEPDLIATERVERISSVTNFMGRLVTLLMWHDLDPVDDAERLRNDRVFTLYQHNRNPFIDQPEWVREVFWPRMRIQFAPDRTTAYLFWSADFASASVQARLAFPPEWLPPEFDWLDLVGLRFPVGDEVRFSIDATNPRKSFLRLRLW